MHLWTSWICTFKCMHTCTCASCRTHACIPCIPRHTHVRHIPRYTGRYASLCLSVFYEGGLYACASWLAPACVLRHSRPPLFFFGSVFFASSPLLFCISFFFAFKCPSFQAPLPTPQAHGPFCLHAWWLAVVRRYAPVQYSDNNNNTDEKKWLTMTSTR